ncbi:aldo/keto reductase family oxidoreductase [Shigella flexneri 2930-71]|nr:aldo/keto reductase family oxidoreductase [Shigella flexneri 2930-71]
MQELWQLPGGNQCATNQVLYHLGSRGIEYDLLPWCQQQQMPVMAYSPLAQAGRLRNGLLKNAVVNEIAHVQQHAAALEVELSSAELAMLDKAYPAPKGKTALDMV